MASLQMALAWLEEYGWQALGVLLTCGYLAILGIMVRKILRDRALPEDERPGPRPLFYLGQAYLAFIWPVPLFLALEALDVLTP